MSSVYCKYCGGMTEQQFRQRVDTYEEAQQKEAALLRRMEGGELGVFDVITAKVLQNKLVREQKNKVERFWRDMGLDETMAIEGKDMYNCTVCDRINFV